MQRKVASEIVYGLHPVLLALRANRRIIHRLFIQEKNRREDSVLSEIVETARSQKIPVGYASREQMEKWAEDGVHQGAVMFCNPLPMIPLDGLPKVEDKQEEKRPLWIGLDSVSDPQNFGAILRTATFFGVSGVIIESRKSCPISSVVSKASAGAAEIFPVHECSSLLKFTTKSKENGWKILATTGEGGNDISATKQTSPTLLLLGAEGSGLRQSLVDAADVLVTATGVGARAAQIGSLNVSVAAGIMIHHLTTSAAKQEE